MKESIAQRLYQLRKEKNLSQQHLAKAIGVTQKAIDFWEKGINEPKASYIVNLSIYFGVSAGYLLGLED
ncbi:MAG: helix-turn-helix transcriptional regulator [Clostridia bacterium]|nr:helix-turn-helix transcriptional regulator [Clostridia bacterium]